VVSTHRVRTHCHLDSSRFSAHTTGSRSRSRGRIEAHTADPTTERGLADRHRGAPSTLPPTAPSPPPHDAAPSLPPHDSWRLRSQDADEMRRLELNGGHWRHRWAPSLRPRTASSVPAPAGMEQRRGQFALPPTSARTGGKSCCNSSPVATTSSPRCGSSPRVAADRASAFVGVEYGPDTNQ
jgi:hypothetical protein